MRSGPQPGSDLGFLNLDPPAHTCSHTTSIAPGPLSCFPKESELMEERYCSCLHPYPCSAELAPSRGTEKVCWLTEWPDKWVCREDKGRMMRLSCDLTSDCPLPFPGSSKHLHRARHCGNTGTPPTPGDEAKTHNKLTK